MVSFKKSTSNKDLITLEKLAGEIWTEYFTPIIGAPQVDYMLETIQSFEAMRKQVKEGYIYYLIKVDASEVGYICIKPDSQGLFLSKLYLLKSHRGQGLGKSALQFILTTAKRMELSRIWLTVNKHNKDTIEAYKKWGFEITEELVMDIGGGFVMDDYKMVKVIN